jgi:hypothetical protein
MTKQARAISFITQEQSNLKARIFPLASDS